MDWILDGSGKNLLPRITYPKKDKLLQKGFLKSQSFKNGRLKVHWRTQSASIEIYNGSLAS